MKCYQDKVAVITGGASGIGRAVGEELARSGARVVLSDIDEPSLRATAGALEGAIARPADVRDPDAVQQLIDGTVDSYGRIDYLFNNAGICVVAETLDLELDDWQRVLDVNLRGVIHGVHAAYPVMATQGFGHIVNIASVAGLIPLPHVVPYCATKHAVVGLSRALRAEAESYGVRVSCVCPGFIATSIYEHSRYVNFDRDQLVASLPFEPVAADRCARAILSGVARNRAEIVVTPHGHVLAGLQRLAPRVLARLVARRAGRDRTRRTKLAGS